MNKAQRTVLVAGLLVAVAMVVYPPWVVTLTNTEGYLVGDSAYRVLTSDATRAEGKHYQRGGLVDCYNSFEIDLKRLFLQLLGAGLLTAAGYVLVGGRKAAQVEAAEPKEDDTPN